MPPVRQPYLKQRRKTPKLILDFDGTTRFLILALHKGHCMRCDNCRRTYRPKFPSIEGTAFGIGVLGCILEYAGKNTDEDISYYLKVFNKYRRGATTIWNARKAPGAMLAPTLRLIIDDLKKAPFLIIHETPVPLQEEKGLRVGGAHRHGRPGGVRPGQGSPVRPIVPARAAPHAGRRGRIRRV